MSYKLHDVYTSSQTQIPSQIHCDKMLWKYSCLRSLCGYTQADSGLCLRKTYSSVFAALEQKSWFGVSDWKMGIKMWFFVVLLLARTNLTCSLGWIMPPVTQSRSDWGESHLHSEQTLSEWCKSCALANTTRCFCSFKQKIMSAHSKHSEQSEFLPYILYIKLFHDFSQIYWDNKLLIDLYSLQRCHLVVFSWIYPSSEYILPACLLHEVK